MTTFLIVVIVLLILSIICIIKIYNEDTRYLEDTLLKYFNYYIIDCGFNIKMEKYFNDVYNLYYNDKIIAIIHYKYDGEYIIRIQIPEIIANNIVYTVIYYELTEIDKLRNLLNALKPIY